MSANKKTKILAELKENPKNIRFNDLCKAAEIFGFRYRGGRGSHSIFVKEGIPEMLNFQNVSGMAKPYQVRQLIRIIKKYHLEE